MSEEKVKAKKPGFFQKIARFFRELKSEVKKVVWPTKKQLGNNFVIVLAFCLVTGAFIWIIDAVLSLVIRLIYGA